MKICFICNTKKPLDDFYKHKKMSDGHLNKCKSCTKEQSKVREKKLRNDPKWVESEKIRSRERYHRLYSTVKHPLDENYNRIWMTDEERTLSEYEIKKKWKEANPEKVNMWNKNYRLKYPEKYKAHIAAQHLPCKKGNHMHHWSYNTKDFRDVIELSISDHALLHRFLKYDQNELMYRNIEGCLLNTKQAHIDLLFEIKRMENVA